MKAIIVTDCYEQFKGRLEETFDDFVVYQLDNDPKRYYEQAHAVAAQASHPLFLFLSNPVLAAIVTAHIMRRRYYVDDDGKVRFPTFYIVENLESRLRVLKLP
ncbi:MAG: hypothetical protein DRJ38_00235 [Thermoprotei archaeon]|nr:MAG: hypothetical protein DRJ38_00235 [Thermoprotei archaeon]